MAESELNLIATPPCAGLLPLSIGTVTASEEPSCALTSIAPYRGQDGALSDALKKAHGMAWPKPGRMTGKAGARALWFGQGQALLVGPAPDAELARNAALTDQSDAWAMVRLSGAGAQDVLARLTPLDLRRGSFKRGHTARTEIAHMMGSLTRLGEEAFLILVFRSMAATLAHDLETAMQSVAARKRL
ncbi:sarcosine oxidase subunit gamma [Aquicoccus sp.]|uniref:sarcosine oxidase subunit gamma n=1 Tax=Aquicoccus sp. TaxID=2055851 RepID=UPI00356B03C8